jgi:hypothetical protein
VRLPEGLVLLSAGEEGSGLKLAQAVLLLAGEGGGVGLAQVVSLLAGEGEGNGLVQAVVPLPAGDGDGVQLVLVPAAGEAAGTPLLRVW